MSTLVDQAWLDAQRAASGTLPERSGATALVEYTITGGPDGPVVFHTSIEDGRIAAAALGAAAEADFAMAMPHAEFLAIVAGDADPKVGYMQGRIKVTGNVGRMLSVLPVIGWFRPT